MWCFVKILNRLIYIRGKSLGLILRIKIILWGVMLWLDWFENLLLVLDSLVCRVLGGFVYEL